MNFGEQFNWEWVVEWFSTTGISVLVIIVATLIAIKGVKIFANRITRTLDKSNVTEEAKKRASTLSSVVRNTMIVTVIVISIITILDQFGIKIGPILAAAGIVGLAIGFGAQNLVQDVINGFFILLENQIRVGDVVEIAGKSGLVEKVNLKMTVLRDLAGNVHYVSNRQINIVTNMTKDYSRYVFNIGVAYREDVDEVIDVIREVDEEVRSDPAFKDDILEPIEILGLDQFADSAIIIKARTTTKPIKQWSIGREFNRRLKKAFDAKNIEIPFPHVTLYMGQDKDGGSPPMNVNVKQGSQA